MGDVKLLPCPFCGEDAKTTWQMDESAYSHDIVKHYRTGCWVCEFHMDGEDELELADAWNTRTSPALTPKQAAADEMYDAAEELLRCLNTEMGTGITAAMGKARTTLDAWKKAQ